MKMIDICITFKKLISYNKMYVAYLELKVSYLLMCFNLSKSEYSKIHICVNIFLAIK